ncbi:MAG: hypothetical protein M1821_005323 [Bathelium mastoideum]|nr:MAG: hypothetical protein M1821_005323 [Bathelium mastoideum]KAI9688129.1 MAG: hypothetical protein M1822_001635 [Bathelium mastoideum]
MASNRDAVNGAFAISSRPNGSDAADIPVTKLFANFVSTVKLDVLGSTLRTKLKEVIIDYIGVTAAAGYSVDSTPAICKAVDALGGTTGASTAITKGKHFTPQYAGFLNATFGHSLDFDDTYAPGTLHAGVTAISAALSQAELLGVESDSDRFLLAVAVGYEVTCRLGRELGYEAYSQGMHNTATAGIFGAVAALAVLKKLKSEVVEMAFGFAGSKASGSMQFLFNGSHNKRLHAGFAVHDAFICVALAEAGALGATRIIEGNFGFLNAYSPNPNKDLRRLTEGLGTQWEWLASALKPYPACRMTHGFIEMAGDLANNSKKEVTSITCALSPSNFSVVGQHTPNKVHPENVVDAQFSAYFQTAYAWTYGSNTGVAAYNRLKDSKIHNLCERITCIEDSSLVGFGSWMKVKFVDGSETQRNTPFPLGEVEHPYTRDRVDQKFFSLATQVYGEDNAIHIRDVVDNIEKHTVIELMDLLGKEASVF